VKTSFINPLYKPLLRSKIGVLMSYHIKIENVVASAILHCTIKLEKVVSMMEGIEYEPEQFPGVVYRMKNPKAAALIFGSGKLVCTGTTSPGMAKEVVARVVRDLRKIGTKVPHKYDVRMENIVASAKIEQEVNLDEIAFTLENTEYEPEQFPGLVFRMTEPKVTFLLFTSGKVICTGARSVADVGRAVEKLDKRLRLMKRTGK